jgi:hypothetical protein
MRLLPSIVGHGTQRVPVATMMVRALAPGEVAPKGPVVAAMVALERVRIGAEIRRDGEAGRAFAACLLHLPRAG